MAFLKISGIIIALIVFLRLRFNLSLSIFLVSVLSIVFFQINLNEAFISSVNILIEERTLQLYLIIILVIYISSVQRLKGMFDLLIKSLTNLISDKKIVSQLIPAFIGLLPMPGGALFSAPLVDVSLKDLKIDIEFKTFINYWFRHVWEFVWPIYAGLLFFHSLSGISLKRIIILQMPFSVLNILSGVIMTQFYFRKHKIQGKYRKKRIAFIKNLINIFESMWPIILVILMFFIFSTPLHLGLLVTSLLLSIVKKVRLKDLKDIFFSKKMLDIIVLITIVMIFQQMVKMSNISEGLLLFNPSTFIIVLICFFISFSMGFLTGVNTAFIVIAFPILAPLISQLSVISYESISIYIYVTGFAGILLSPVHLCLVLTNDYFKSNLLKVYKYLAPPVIILIIFATVLLFI